jgi:hypothetical protein
MSADVSWFLVCSTSFIMQVIILSVTYTSHVICDSLSVIIQGVPFIAVLPTPQLTRDVPADAGFLYDKAAVLGET